MEIKSALFPMDDIVRNDKSIPEVLVVLQGQKPGKDAKLMTVDKLFDKGDDENHSRAGPIRD